ncbi:MAG TPA: ABC transporter permease [Acidimicrobiales bacterium]|nr:ABC transporter permease [Acidimicrobiales bacterium]
MSSSATATILARRARPRALPVLAAFVRRDWGIAWSYRFPFVLGLGQGFATVGFLYFLSRLVGGRIVSSSGGLHGGYFAFSVLGTMLLGFFSVTLTAFAQRLRADQTAGTLEVLFTMPPRPALSVLGSASYQLLYSTIANLVSLLLAVAVGLRFSAAAPGALLAIADIGVSFALFSAVGIAFAAFVMVFKRGETLTAIGTSALVLVGGVYYPVSLMPHALRLVAEILPFTWALEILRSSLLSSSLPLARFGELCGATILAIPVALWLFSAALDRARRTGTLGQY